jgi:hypothetical protein
LTLVYRNAFKSDEHMSKMPIRHKIDLFSFYVCKFLILTVKNGLLYDFPAR